MWAIPEGRLFFCNEPVVEVTAPLIEAQVVETLLINQVNFQSLVATKASRCMAAAQGKTVIDFGFRRAHGIDAGIQGARACFIVGFEGTSNLEAARLYGILPVGTMAHSFVTCFEQEVEAFRAYARTFPRRSIFLIDTYDTLAGARKAVQVAKELAAQGHALVGVRLDSGDLGSLAWGVRRLLDEAGFPSVRIVASGGLDEYEIEDLLRQGAPIDVFAVGTKVLVAGDGPWSDMAYKLVKYQGRPVLKLSPGKATLPEAKQVFRLYDGLGMAERDVIALREEKVEGGEPLLVPVMERGRRVAPGPSLREIRDLFQREFARLRPEYKVLRNPPLYPVELSPRLEALAQELGEALTLTEVKGRGLGEG